MKPTPHVLEWDWAWSHEHKHTQSWSIMLSAKGNISKFTQAVWFNKLRPIPFIGLS